MEIYSHHLETWTNQHSVQFPYSPGTNSYMEKSGNPSQQTFAQAVLTSLCITGHTWYHWWLKSHKNYSQPAGASGGNSFGDGMPLPPCSALMCSFIICHLSPATKGAPHPIPCPFPSPVKACLSLPWQLLFLLLPAHLPAVVWLIIFTRLNNWCNLPRFSSPSCSSVWQAGNSCSSCASLAAHPPPARTAQSSLYLSLGSGIVIQSSSFGGHLATCQQTKALMSPAEITSQKHPVVSCPEPKHPDGAPSLKNCCF